VNKDDLLARLEEDFPHYAHLRDRKEPNVPADMTAAWDELVSLSDADEVARSRVRRLADSKGFSIGALVRQGVRVKHYKSGETHLAWGVRHVDGFVCGIKYRSLGPRFPGRKTSEEGSAFAHPALPSLYSASGSPTCVWVAEGETDSAWLLDRAGADEGVLCHHAGGMTYRAEWAELLRDVPRVVLATDSDEVGEWLAEQYMSDLPQAERRRPRGKDWCDS
jgi:hypothetical protein